MRERHQSLTSYKYDERKAPSLTSYKYDERKAPSFSLYIYDVKGIISLCEYDGVEENIRGTSIFLKIQCKRVK